MPFLALVGIFALIVLSSIVNGYVLSILWSWFIVPTFGLAPLQVAAAIGLTMVVRLVVDWGKGRADGSDFGETFGAAFVGPFVFLGIAWAVKQFM